MSSRGTIITQPSTLNFGGISEERLMLGDMTKAVVLSKLRGDFEVTGVKFSSSYLSAEVSTLEEGTKYRIDVKLAPKVLKRTYLDEMVIYTNDPTEQSDSGARLGTRDVIPSISARKGRSRPPTRGCRRAG